MTLDKRKRKKVNAAVQKIALQRKKIRDNRIEGDRSKELEACIEISAEITEAKKKLDANTDFSHRLESFDTELIECHALPIKKKGKWEVGRDDNKESKLAMEIDKFQAQATNKEKHLKEWDEKKYATALPKLALSGQFIPE